MSALVHGHEAAAAVLAAADTLRTGGGEATLFWIAGPLSVLAALGMLIVKKAVHSALLMALIMVCLAFFYIAQHAPFLGIVQIVVYTGAVMMLFLFVLMLVGVDSADSLVETIRGQRWSAILAGAAFAVLLLAALGHAIVPNVVSSDATAAADGGVTAIAKLLFTRYVWSFEVTSALLITAALGTMVLAHGERLEARKTQRELSEERFRRGGDVSMLPAPGVYARHNAVDVPGLLPDGTPSELSLSRVLVARGTVRDARSEASDVRNIEQSAIDADGRPLAAHGGWDANRDRGWDANEERREDLP
ncbi:MAG: NADH-quinone oxidoreductase subunit J [Actinomycetes bacterium]